MKRATVRQGKKVFLLLAMLSTSAFAAPPVTINNAGNSDAATVTSHRLDVNALVTPGGTQDVNVAQVNGTTVLTGSGATGTGSQRVTVAVDSATVAGSASLPAGTNAIGSLVQSGINVAVTPTIQNASYVSGNCMGGFQTIALGTTASVLNQVALRSQGGLVTAKQIYLFSASPAASTCSDKSTFTLNSADVSKLMLTFSITPSVPTGTTVSAASQSNLGLGIPSGGNVYMAIVETATETPATTSDLVVNFSAF